MGWLVSFTWQTEIGNRSCRRARAFGQQHQVISIKIRSVLYQLSMLYADLTSICCDMRMQIANT